MIGRLKPERILQMHRARSPQELKDVFLAAVTDIPAPRTLISRPMFRDESAQLTEAYRQIYEKTIPELREAGKNIVELTCFIDIIDVILETEPAVLAGGGHIMNGSFLAIIKSGLIADFLLPETFRKSPRMLWEYEVAKKSGLFPLFYAVLPTDRKKTK